MGRDWAFTICPFDSDAINLPYEVGFAIGRGKTCLAADSQTNLEGKQTAMQEQTSGPAINVWLCTNSQELS